MTASRACPSHASPRSRVSIASGPREAIVSSAALAESRHAEPTRPRMPHIRLSYRAPHAGQRLVERKRNLRREALEHGGVLRTRRKECRAQDSGERVCVAAGYEVTRKIP